VLLERGRHLLAFAADDAHFTEFDDGFGGWVWVRAPSLDHEALLAALKAGHFHSSQGPELHDLRIVGETLHVACSPVVALHLTGRGARRLSQRGWRCARRPAISPPFAVARVA